MKRILLCSALAVLVPIAAVAERQDKEQINKNQVKSESQRLDERSDMRAAMKDESKAQREAESTLRAASKVYDEMVLRSPKGSVPVSVQSHAKCIAIFPNTITAGVVLGGTRGNGVVSCKNGRTWSAPVFANLTGASFGAQIGGKSTDMVLFINSDSAVSAIKQGKFGIGGDMSIAVGSYDANADTSQAGIVSYQRNEGGYVGASLGSGNISLDETTTREYFGNELSANKIIDGTQTAKTGVSQELTSKLPA